MPDDNQEIVISIDFEKMVSEVKCVFSKLLVDLRPKMTFNDFRRHFLSSKGLKNISNRKRIRVPYRFFKNEFDQSRVVSISLFSTGSINLN